MEQLTAESMRAAIQRLREVNVPPVDGYYKMIVHPLRWLLIQRGVDPVYCRYLGIRLRANWKEIYDQTFADYEGNGINGSES